MDLSWKTIKSNIVWRGRFPVLIDRLRAGHDGRETDYTYLGMRGAAVVVLALDADDRVVCVRQYRHPVARVTLELPAGHIDRGESPDVAAAREFEEETGLVVGDLRSLGVYLPIPSLAGFRMHMYLGRDLSPGRQDLDEVELLEVVRVPLADLRRDVVEGRCEVVALNYTLLLAERMGLLPQ